jgi:hypothetical protein
VNNSVLRSRCLTEGATDVTQENGAGTANQQWSLTTSGGCTTLKSRASGESLDVNGASTANSAVLIAYTCTGGVNQQWTHGT